MDKNTAKIELTRLIEHLQTELVSGATDQYQEEESKNVFILPLLKNVLGWDYNNRNEVGAEHTTSKGRVDYSLKIDGNIKLFVEVKSVGDDITKYIDQALKYGKNYDKVPFILLTNFKRLMLFDVWYGKKNRGLKLDLQWDSYLDNLEQLLLISKESVKSGSLNDLLSQKPTGRKLVEKAIVHQLLNDFLKWRNDLATSIFKHNSHLFHSEDLDADSNYLKDITQKILDRIIFIRFCEDRGLVQEKKLIEVFSERENIVGTGAIHLLKPIYSSYERIFNSDLFKPQIWEDNLGIDFKVINNIILKTYDDYLFDVIPIEVLGSIYEQYLGHDIRVTNHTVKREVKNGLRKIKGIYYTPEYIVNYIVNNTVGTKLSELSPSKAKNIRILDPACGSGSFLIRAYDEILNYYLEERKSPLRSDDRQQRLIKGQEHPEPKLSLKEKSEILLKHIFGVDLDDQAVEITKLSLMLKMLEGEHTIIPGRAILPILDKNIRRGNSLIGPDSFEADLIPDDKELRRLHPLDWKIKFADAMNAGGFDCIVGNPPYVRPHKLTRNMKELLWKSFTTFVAKSDLYSCFMEKGLNLLKPNGLFSFIVPHTWTSLESFTKIRGLIIKKSRVRKLVQLPKRVFAQATVETCIFVFEKHKTKADKYMNMIKVERLDSGGNVSSLRQFNQKEIMNAYIYNFQLYKQNDGKSIIGKIQKEGRSLSEYVNFLYGFKTGDDQKFIHQKKVYKESKPFIRSGAIRRYGHDDPGEYVWYVPSAMIRNRKTARPGESERFEAEKIIVARMGKTLVATYDPGGLYVKDAMLLLGKNSNLSLKYILGIINSKTLGYFYQEFFITIDVLKNSLLSLPIYAANYSKRADKVRYDKIIRLVEQMLDLHQKANAAKNQRDLDFYQNQIESIDAEIDILVYDLYGITDKERKIIEKSLNEKCL